MDEFDLAAENLIREQFYKDGYRACAESIESRLRQLEALATCCAAVDAYSRDELAEIARQLLAPTTRGD